MGGKPGKQTPKPLLYADKPTSSKAVLCTATFTELDDREATRIVVSSSPNACFLPWKDFNFTECIIDLSAKNIKYFFTSEFSGCSLWYKFEDKTLAIRHEARTDEVSQGIHKAAKFTLLVDSSKDPEIAYSVEGMTRTGVFYLVYALLDHDECEIEFRLQKIKNIKNLETRDEVYTLHSIATKSIKFSLKKEGKYTD